MGDAHYTCYEHIFWFKDIGMLIIQYNDKTHHCGNIFTCHFVRNTTLLFVSIYIIGHILDVFLITLASTDALWLCLAKFWSTNSINGSMVQPDRSSASASLSVLVMLFRWFLFNPFPRISLTTFMVSFGLFNWHCSIFSNGKPSSRPRWMYCFEIRSETASSSCGVAFCSFRCRKYLGYSSAKLAIR